MSKKRPYKKTFNGFELQCYVNNDTYFDYIDRLMKLALSIFEWVNLPESMNARYIEYCLFFDGKCAFLYDEDYGAINTRCATDGFINIYNQPTSFKCYSYDYHKSRKLYTGLVDDNTKNNSCVLVLNNMDYRPTAYTINLFAYRLYEAESTAMTNIKAQKTPVLIVCDEKQRTTMQNAYEQYNENYPVIFGDKLQLSSDSLRAVKTDAPFIANDIMEYKKLIWNEALTFLGINNIEVEKKERLVKDESNANNELINLNLMSYLAPRQEACRQFNDLMGFTGTGKEISVRVRSDLLNVIKNNNSVINDYDNNGILDNKESDLNE